MKNQEYYTVRTAPNTLSNMVHGQAFRIITPHRKGLHIRPCDNAEQLCGFDQKVV